MMPDGTSRFSINGKPILHYMGCSTFSECTVLPEISLANISKSTPWITCCPVKCACLGPEEEGPCDRPEEGTPFGRRTRSRAML